MAPAPALLGPELLHAAAPARTGTLRAARPRKLRRDIPFDSTLISVLARRGPCRGCWVVDADRVGGSRESTVSRSDTRAARDCRHRWWRNCRFSNTRMSRVGAVLGLTGPQSTIRAVIERDSVAVWRSARIVNRADNVLKSFRNFLNRAGIGTAYDRVGSRSGCRVDRPPLAGRHPAARRTGRARCCGRITLEEKVAQLGSRWMGGALWSLAPTRIRTRRIARPRSMSHRCRTCSPPAAKVVAGGGEPARPRPSHPGLRKRAGHRRRRARPKSSASSASCSSRIAARHPRARARGMPDRLHHLRRHRLPGCDRLGRDLRPRARRADGGRDRARHGRARRPPGAVAGARRRARLPVGTSRGDDRARTRTSSRCSARPTSAACRAPV